MYGVTLALLWMGGSIRHFWVEPIGESDMFYHGLFTNEWETRSRDVWKPVSNRTLGIVPKICKLRGGTPALLRPVGTLQDFAWLDLGKNDSSSIN